MLIDDRECWGGCYGDTSKSARMLATVEEGELLCEDIFESRKRERAAQAAQRRVSQLSSDPLVPSSPGGADGTWCFSAHFSLFFELTSTLCS